MASVSMQDLPESLKQRDGSMYAMQPVRASLRAFAAKRDQIAGGYSRKLLILWWALQDSNLRLPPCESTCIWIFNDLQHCGDCQSTRKSCKTVGFAGWVVGCKTLPLASISRRLNSQLNELLRHPPTVVLLGPHQAGKTTLALEIGERTASIYLDFEDENDRAMLANPRKNLADHEIEQVILDEVHRVPELTNPQIAPHTATALQAESRRHR
jgi:hypothetical protein